METLKNPGINFPVISGLTAIILTGMLLIFIASLTKLTQSIHTYDRPAPVIINYKKLPEPVEPVREEEVVLEPMDPMKNPVPPNARPEPETVIPGTLTPNVPGTIEIPEFKPGKTTPIPTVREIFPVNMVDRAPRILRAITPVYPFDAKSKGIQGKVVLRFIVDEDGRVQAPEVIKAEPEGVFEESALAAIVKYRFDPAVIGSKKVKCLVVLPVGFRLN